jgi:small GTP-binding protein
MDDNNSDNNKNANNEIKVILLGESGVGKTNLINVTIGNSFDPNTNSTLLYNSNIQEYIYNNKKYKYNIWDTAGQEAYRAVNKLFIKDSKIVIIVFAIDKKETFNEIHYWINSIKEILEEGKYILALVGNKIDLYEKQEVMEKEMEEEANKYNMKYITTSAFTQPSVFKKFLEELILEYITKFEKGDNEKNTLQLNRKKNLKNKKCNC